MPKPLTCPAKSGWRAPPIRPSQEPSTVARSPRERRHLLGFAGASAPFLPSVCTAAGFHFRPFSISPEYGAARRLRFRVRRDPLRDCACAESSLRRLIGAATGSILGILGAYLISLIFTHTTMPESTRSFFSLAIFLVMTYIGLVLGANKGDMLNLQAFGGVFGSERNTEALVQTAGYQRDH